MGPEIHFLLHYELFELERAEMEANILADCPNYFNILDIYEDYYVLTCGGKCLYVVSKYCCEAIKKKSAICRHKFCPVVSCVSVDRNLICRVHYIIVFI